MEKLFEQVMYSARWLLAPIYLGMSLVLMSLVFEFFQGVTFLLLNVFDMSESDVILKVLGLIDVVLVGGLVVMVMYSGYENFVSKLDIDDNTEKLSWLGTMDTASLKSKVAASIVAISSIHLLKIFMNLENMESDKMMWFIISHLTFVASAFFMGLLDLKKKQFKRGLENLPSL